MIEVYAKNSTEAWEKINEAFILNDPRFSMIYKSKALYAHHILLHIENPELDPNFNFGRYFNYTKSKWNNLVGNYCYLSDLASLKQQIQGQKEFNLGFQFTNTHDHGKKCLLSATFTKISSKDKVRVTMFLRASEVTKRLPMDLLLIQRICEFVIGDTHLWDLTLILNQAFNDDMVLLMYNAHKSIKEVLYPATDKWEKWKQSKHIGEYAFKNALERSKILIPRLEEALQTDPKDVKYKIHRRAIKVLRPDLCKYPKLLAKDCHLPQSQLKLQFENGN